MRVTIFPADEGGCGHYRLIWPGQELQRQGHDITIALPETENARVNAVMQRQNGREEVVDVQPPDADVVVLQRPLARLLADTIPHLQRRGIAVVVEIDDDFDSISPRNAAWRSANPKYSPERNRQHLARACKLADLVTVSTPALAERYGQHGRVEILPNFVPERYLAVEHVSDDQGLYLGWSGSVHTHPDDLQVVGWGVQRALRDANANMAIVGTGVGVHRNLSLPSASTVKISGWMPIEQYPDAVSQLDVGIVPLENSVFNQAKSWLKGLEYAALGVPFIASPTDSYLELSKHGLGALADGSKQWYNTLRNMLQSKQFAAELGASQRERVRQLEFTIEAQAGRWLAAWAKARARA